MSIFSAILEGHSLSPPLLYGITHWKHHPDTPLQRYLEAAFATRCHLLQWREKDLSAELQQTAAEIGAQLAEKTGKLFLVNTWTDLALRVGADGVHLTSLQSVPESRQKRENAGKEDNFLIGKSVHTVREAVQAEAEGADYLLLGPVFDPISKQAQRMPLGLSGLRESTFMLYTPVFALGGVKLHDLNLVESTNAVGLAGISWFSEEIGEVLAGRR